MAVEITNVAARSMLDNLTALIEAGSTNPTPVLRILTGARPTNADDAETGTLLAELEMSADAFNAATDGGGSAVASGNAVSDDPSADASGTAGYCRILDRDGNVVMQGDAGLNASGAFLEMVTLSIVAGQPVQVTSMSLSYAEAQS